MPAYDPTLNLRLANPARLDVMKMPGRAGSAVAAGAAYSKAKAKPGSSPWRLGARDTLPPCDLSASAEAASGSVRGEVPGARRDLSVWCRAPEAPHALNSSYRLAFADSDFLARDELRPLRLQLEMLKTEMALTERGIESTIAMFGSASIPDPKFSTYASPARNLSPFYAEAREFARLITLESVASDCRENVICTGGGAGIMEAGNRGAADAGGISISLNVVLPHEQSPNPHATPDLTFNFHCFAIRKMHFLMRAKAVAVFPGGFGTLDEMFEVLTLVQIGRLKPLPILLFGKEFWREVINWEALADAGTIARRDLGLITFVDCAAEAVALLDAWHHSELSAETKTAALIS